MVSLSHHKKCSPAPRRCKSLLEVGLLDPEGLDDPCKGKVLKQGVSEEEINDAGQNQLKTNKDLKTNIYIKRSF